MKTSALKTLIAAAAIALAAGCATTETGTMSGGAEPSVMEQSLGKDEIVAAQNALKKAGFFPGEVTGKIDDETVKAVRNYQLGNRLAVTGILDEPTLKKLMVR